MLLDVHADPQPRVEVERVCTETHRCGRFAVERRGHDADRCPGGDRLAGHVAESDRLTGDDDNPAHQAKVRCRAAHVHSVQSGR